MTERSPQIKAASLVIPTLNRHQCLRSLLVNLSKQNTLPRELIVVEQGAPSPPQIEFSALAQLGVHCRYVFSPFKSAALARNIGLILADMPILIYLDDDVEPLTDIVLNFTSALNQHSEASGIVGHVLCRHPAPQVVAANTFQPTGTYVRIGLSSNVAFRTDALLNIGGFNPLIPCHGEETELFMRMERANLPILNGPDAVVLHLVEQAGGVRETLFRSYKWYLDFVRSNSTRIARLYSFPSLFPWTIKNYRLFLNAFRAARNDRGHKTDLLRSLMDGARLGHITRRIDTIALTSALVGSSIGGPQYFLRATDRKLAMDVYRRLSSIADKSSRLEHCRGLISVTYETQPKDI